MPKTSILMLACFSIVIDPQQPSQGFYTYSCSCCILLHYLCSNSSIVVKSLRSTQSSTAIRPSLATFQFPGCCLGHTTTGQGLHLTTPDPQGAGLKNSVQPSRSVPSCSPFASNQFWVPMRQSLGESVFVHMDNMSTPSEASHFWVWGKG
jgi:hypothetical protein